MHTYLAVMVLGSNQPGDGAADFDVVMFGAGANGLMCPIHAWRSGLRALAQKKALNRG